MSDERGTGTKSGLSGKEGSLRLLDALKEFAPEILEFSQLAARRILKLADIWDVSVCPPGVNPENPRDRALMDTAIAAQSGWEAAVARDIQYELLRFYYEAFGFTQKHPKGALIIKRIAGKIAGKAGALPRKKAKLEFWAWAKEELRRRPSRTRNELAQLYIKDRSLLQFPTVRAWLTPKEGWQPEPGWHQRVKS